MIRQAARSFGAPEQEMGAEISRLGHASNGVGDVAVHEYDREPPVVSMDWKIGLHENVPGDPGADPRKPVPGMRADSKRVRFPTRRAPVAGLITASIQPRSSISWVRSTLDPAFKLHRWDDRDPSGLEVLQVGFVRCHAQDPGRVPDVGGQGGRIGPREELILVERPVEGGLITQTLIFDHDIRAIPSQNSLSASSSRGPRTAPRPPAWRCVRDRARIADDRHVAWRLSRSLTRPSSP